MGTWGLGTFEDDIARDWLEDLYDSDPFAFFSHCLDLTGHDYLEFLACVGIVCTAEVLHGLVCGPREGLPSGVHDWIDSHNTLNVTHLMPTAIAGLRRVIGPDSQMRDLWEDDASRFDDWKQQVGDLRNRLELALAKNA
jgi:hypothetical protein